MVEDPEEHDQGEDRIAQDDPVGGEGESTVASDAAAASAEGGKKRKKKKQKPSNGRHPCLWQHGECQYGDYCKLKDLPGNTCIHHFSGVCAHGDQCRLRHALGGVDIRELTNSAPKQTKTITDESGRRFVVTNSTGKVQMAVRCEEDEAAEAAKATFTPEPLPAFLVTSSDPRQIPAPYCGLFRDPAAGGKAQNSPTRTSPSSAVPPPTISVVVAGDNTPSKTATSSVGLHPCVARYGSCKYGAKCAYADRAADVCIFFLQGRCKHSNDTCTYRHESEEEFLTEKAIALGAVAPPPHHPAAPAVAVKVSDEDRSVTLLTLASFFPEVPQAILLALLKRHQDDFSATYDALMEGPKAGDGSRRLLEELVKARELNAANQVKLQRIQKRFPNTDREMIAHLLSLSNGDEAATIETLGFFINEGDATPAAFSTQPVPLARTQQQRQGRGPAAQEDAVNGIPSAEAVAAELRAFRQQAGLGPQQGDPVAVRKDAVSLNYERLLVVSSATQAFRSDRRKEASELSREGKVLEKRYLELNRFAMLLLEERRLHTEELCTLDLHYFHSDEVLEVMYRRLQLCVKRKIPVLRVVVGQGLHSIGKATLLPVVQQELERSASPLAGMVKGVVPNCNIGVFKVVVRH